MTETSDQRLLAARAIVRALRNPFAMVSKPDREEVFELARRFDLTALDLLNAAYEKRYQSMDFDYG